MKETKANLQIAAVGQEMAVLAVQSVEIANRYLVDENEDYKFMYQAVFTDEPLDTQVGDAVAKYVKFTICGVDRQ